MFMYTYAYTYILVCTGINVYKFGAKIVASQKYTYIHRYIRRYMCTYAYAYVCLHQEYLSIYNNLLLTAKRNT